MFSNRIKRAFERRDGAIHFKAILIHNQLAHGNDG